MGTQRQPGIEYGLWWLAAVVVLPILDVALVVAVDGALFAPETPVALVLALIAAACANAVALCIWGRRIGVPAGTILAATFLSYLAAIVAFLIFVYAVVAPKLA